MVSPISTHDSNDDCPERRFTYLLTLLRNGDRAAAEEIVAIYGPHIRRVIRRRLTNRPLRRMVDTEDICQSVLCDFFRRVSLGQYELNNEFDLRALLAKMAANRVVFHVQRQTTAKRDYRRNAEDGDFSVDRRRECTSASSIVMTRDLLEACQRKFSEEEWSLVTLRASGQSWRDIGLLRGVSADALRIKLTRAINRVATEFDDHASHS